MHNLFLKGSYGRESWMIILVKKLLKSHCACLLKQHAKEAMLAKDNAALETYRGMLSAFTNELVAKGRKPSEILADEEARAVVKRMIKKSGKAIELFKQGNRPDLAAKEEAEIKIMEAYVEKETDNS